jgi:hypothetical protein
MINMFVMQKCKLNEIIPFSPFRRRRISYRGLDAEKKNKYLIQAGSRHEGKLLDKEGC